MGKYIDSYRDDDVVDDEIDDELEAYAHKLERDLSDVTNMSDIQQKKLEEVQAQAQAQAAQIAALQQENHALRSRLTAVALVIRP